MALVGAGAGAACDLQGALLLLGPNIMPPPNSLQGDEPLIEPECIDAVVRALQDSPDAVYRWAAGLLSRPPLA